MSGGLFAHALLRETGRPVTAEDAAQLQRGHAAAYARLVGQVQPLYEDPADLLRHLDEVGVRTAE